MAQPKLHHRILRLLSLTRTSTRVKKRKRTTPEPYIAREKYPVAGSFQRYHPNRAFEVIDPRSVVAEVAEPILRNSSRIKIDSARAQDYRFPGEGAIPAL